MPSPVRDLHWSGYHSAPARAWRELADTLIEFRAHIGAATEAHDAVCPDGWAMYRPKERGAECVIFWSRDRYREAGPRSDCEGARLLTAHRFFTGRGKVRPGVTATFKLLHDNRDDYDLLRVAGHFPASVQHGDGFSAKVRRVLAWRDAIKGLRKLVRELDRDLQPHEITVSADFNVDLTRKVWRLYLNRAMRGTGLRVKAPTVGTHHARGIDGFLTTLRRHPNGSGVRVLNKIKGFDHRGVLATLARRIK